MIRFRHYADVICITVYDFQYHKESEVLPLYILALLHMLTSETMFIFSASETKTTIAASAVTDVGSSTNQRAASSSLHYYTEYGKDVIGYYFYLINY